MRFVSLVFVVYAFISTSAASAAEWRRETPRMASANVTHTNGQWNISVRFIPVTSFEENKNLLENHRMALSIAEWGLLKELKAKQSQSVETSGMEKIAFSVGKDFAVAEFSVPDGGVRIVEKKFPVHAKNMEDQGNSNMPAWPDSLSDVKIPNAEIEVILRRHPFFVETGGAKILRLADGKVLVASIGMTDATKAPMARRTISERKARAALISHVNGTKVFTETLINNRSVTKVSEKGEAALEITESTERIRESSAGKLQGLDVIGTWILKDGNLFCLAVGCLIPADEVPQYISTVQ